MWSVESYFALLEAGEKGAMETLTWVRNFDMEAADMVVVGVMCDV